MKFAFLLFVSALASHAAANRADVVDLMPMPKSVEFASDMDSPVPFDVGTTVTVECGESAEEWLWTHFSEWFGAAAPKVRTGRTGLSLMDGDEAHAFAADSNGVRVAARTLAGVRWAAYSLCQLAVAKRGTFRTNGRILPMAQCVARHGGFGFVQTTWHALRRAEWRELYVNGSAAAWGTPPQKPAPQYDTMFGNALRFVGHDMKISDPADAGNVNFQIPPTWWIDN